MFGNAQSGGEGSAGLHVSHSSPCPACNTHVLSPCCLVSPPLMSALVRRTEPRGDLGRGLSPTLSSARSQCGVCPGQ